LRHECAGATSAVADDEDSPVDIAVPEDGDDEEEETSPLTCASADVAGGEEEDRDSDPLRLLPAPVGEFSEETTASEEGAAAGEIEPASSYQLWWEKTLREQAEVQGIALRGDQEGAAVPEEACFQEEEDFVATLMPLENQATAVYTYSVKQQQDFTDLWTSMGNGESIKVFGSGGVTRPQTQSTDVPEEVWEPRGHRASASLSHGSEWMIPRERHGGPEEVRLRALEARPGAQGGFFCLRAVFDSPCCRGVVGQSGASQEAAEVQDFTVVEDEEVNPISSFPYCWICPS